jgi:crossover junction endodeoxyribonuclease RuvC
MKFIIGVDPGAHGALAIMETNGRLVRLMDMPVVQVQVGKAVKTRVSPELLAYDLSWYSGEAHAWVEQVTAMPGQGVVSMFSFGLNVGATQAVAEDVFDVAPRFVVPQVWKRYHNLLKQPKSASVDVARTLYPEAVRLCVAKEDSASFIGCCEALLIADWLRHQEVPA